MSETSLHILLVKDNAANDPGMRDSLALQHADMIVRATTMHDALGTLERERFDVVLLDLTSSSTDGAAAVARFHAAVPELPIILFIGADDERIRVRALQEGAQDVLTKSECVGSVLVRAIRYAVERKRADENGRRLIREQAARAEAECSARRARLLAVAGSILASPLEIEVTLQKVASALVGSFGDGCVFDLLEDGGEIRCAAMAHVAKDVEKKIGDLRKNMRSDGTEEHPVLRAMRTKVPAVLRAGKSSSELLALFGGAGVASEALVVPLSARGKILGAATFFVSSASPSFVDEDLAFATELGVRVGLAVDIARLYRGREDTLAVVSHDLRNPLNVIAVASAALRMGTVPEAKKPSYLEKIARAADRMNRLIQDLLDASRMEAGSVTFDWGSVAVSALVVDVLEMMRPLAEGKSVTLVSDVGAALPDLRADRERLLQLFSNILGNAIKFTPEGGTITLSAVPSSDGVCFCVRDTGPGILDAHLSKIFDRYWQARRSDRSGAGLGLAIAKGITHAHSGEIWAESSPGKGASFYVTLPSSGEARPSEVRRETRLHFMG